MSSWDSIAEFYKGHVDRPVQPFAEFRQAILDVLLLLKDDPDLTDVEPGTAMYTLILTIPESKHGSVHVSWEKDRGYIVFLTPHLDAEINEVVVDSKTVITTIKQHLNILLR